MKNRFLAYTEALALDTFLQILTFEQRLQTCQPALVQKLQDWTERKRWQPPAFRYEPETLELLWQDSTAQWLPLAVHPLYQAEVNGK